MFTATFVVYAKPPYKQAPADATEREYQLERKYALQEKAREVISDYRSQDVMYSVDIRYCRHGGKSDSANNIGGILDCLQGIAFSNDKQVVEIHYTEWKGSQDWYQVTVAELAKAPP